MTPLPPASDKCEGSLTLYNHPRRRTVENRRSCLFSLTSFLHLPRRHTFENIEIDIYSPMSSRPLPVGFSDDRCTEPSLIPPPSPSSFLTQTLPSTIHGAHLNTKKITVMFADRGNDRLEQPPLSRGEDPLPTPMLGRRLPY